MVILVLNYFRLLAKLQFLKVRPLVIGIGGSCGKSSLVKLTSLILRQRFKVKETSGANSESGIPLDILGLKPTDYTKRDWLRLIFAAPLKLLTNWERFEVYVVEMGIDGPKEPKNMAYLLKVIKPDIASLTNIALEHSEFFETHELKSGRPPSREKIINLIADQQGLLLTSMRTNDLVVLNIDDERIKRLVNKIEAKVLTVSTKDSGADFYARKIKIDLEGMEMEVWHQGESYSFKTRRPLTFAYAETILLSLALGGAQGISLKDSIDVVKSKFDLPAGRLSIFKGIRGSLIIDSSYNALPLATADALDFLDRVSGNRRKLAILGDMRELGKLSKKEHQAIARWADERIDGAVLIGPLMKAFAVPVLKNKEVLYAFENFSQAAATIKKIVRKGDVVLVKGSQNTLFLERAVELLLKDKKDVTKLCRRGDYWEKIRRQTS